MPPYFVSCFSPLEFPRDVFVHFLTFLSAGDLWKLCQVSKRMYAMVIDYMSRSQRFGFDTVRILRQENYYTSSQLHRVSHETRYEEMMAKHWITYNSSWRIIVPPPPSEPPSTTPEVKFNRGDIRSRYWSAQADRIFEGIIDGTPVQEQQDTAFGAETEATLSYQFMDIDDSSNDPATVVPATSFIPYISSTQPSTISIALSPSSNTNSGRNSPVTQKENGQSKPLPTLKLWDMVSLLFDPNLVQLNHRRALINCARYITSSIEHGFGSAVMSSAPMDPEVHSTFFKDCSVYIGPHLKMLYPCNEAQDAGVSIERRARFSTTLVHPPDRLSSYFQMMLWYRCLSDLIQIHNLIQNRHTRPTVISSERTPGCSKYTTGKSGTLQYSPCSQAIRQDSSPGQTGGLSTYPFCCAAHSLVFVNRQPYQLVPYRLKLRARQTARKVRNMSRRRSSTSALGRVIKSAGAATKLQFCNSARRHQSEPLCSVRIETTQQAKDLEMHWTQNRPAKELKDEHRRQSWLRFQEDADLLRRRFMIEERIRQDTLIKQEFLGLCHMACGLFIVRSRRREAVAPSPTVMTLLRKGSPWNKGVWREGEWRHAPIDLDHDEDEVRLSHRLKVEQEYKFQTKLDRRSGIDHTALNERMREFLLSSTAFGRVGEDDVVDQGPWQKLCLAAIQFLVHEDLAWGGNETNVELSKLRATEHDEAWYYHE
ncbi:hypothetical protein BG011_006737 [Mortierella polycephala]|uniref:F-box domain-containing protein n=1 Tax=Mortierella polycephala TaxID=41804 RepID=A0A9P6PRZ3_9FUNG|nr:hypothetical protein BG011_006737 [Mortierella polycephala]